MIRKKKNYVRPKKPFEKGRIADEAALVKKYGLKNKKEIWKAQAKINYFRSRAKALAKSTAEEQELFFKKLQAIGLKTTILTEVLDLKVEDLLERRLPTVVANKGIANTPKHARQLVVHKKILVDGKVVNTPSFIVPVALEDKLTLKEKKKKPKPQEAPAEKPAEEKPAEQTETPKEESKEQTEETK